MSKAGDRSLGDLAYRWWYHLSMYSGVRALRNRSRCRGRRMDPRLEGLHGTRTAGQAPGEVRLWVHPRPRPAGSQEEHGMVSLRLVTAPIGRWTYRYLCLTSHFGRAHAEVAFHVRGGEITVYGVRNIARANADRLGLSRLSGRLRLAGIEEEAWILQLVATALQRAGLVVRLASAQECVDLSVNDRLLPPGRRAHVRATLLRRYARLTLPIREQAA